MCSGILKILPLSITGLTLHRSILALQGAGDAIRYLEGTPTKVRLVPPIIRYSYKHDGIMHYDFLVLGQRDDFGMNMDRHL